MLRPSPSLRDKLAARIAGECGRAPIEPPPRLREPEWEQVAPGISYRLLACDTERGDYNRAEPGSSDQRVWSETGCTCVLITSPGDQLR